MSLQYLKRKVKDEVDFNTEHQRFLQGGTIIIDGHNQAFS